METSRQRMAELAQKLAHLPAPINGMEKWLRLRLTAPNGVRESGYCERFIHLTYLFPFPELGDEFHDHSALLSAKKWEDSPFVVDDPTHSLPGDLLYWTHGHGEFGHVGGRIYGNWLAENSVVHWDGSDARGVRSLLELKQPDMVVRLTAETVRNWQVK